MAKRCANGVRRSRRLCGGFPEGTKRILPSRNLRAATFAARRCPVWMGSKVPPKSAMFTVLETLSLAHGSDIESTRRCGPGNLLQLVPYCALQILQPLACE